MCVFVERIYYERESTFIRFELRESLGEFILHFFFYLFILYYKNIVFDHDMINFRVWNWRAATQDRKSRFVWLVGCRPLVGIYTRMLIRIKRGVEVLSVNNY